MTPMLSRSGQRAIYSQQVIKDHNSTHLFNLVRKYAPISRADLSRVSGLSPATVTVLMEELLENQWIRELTPTVTPGVRGRRPILLEVNATAGYVATLELLSQGYICTLYDICQNKIAEIRCQEAPGDAADITHSMMRLAQLRGIDRLLGIHILYPGLFDGETGHLGFSAMISNENMVRADLPDILRSQFPLAHIMISNTSTAMAYSVYTAHEPQIAVPLLALSIHEGINAGVVTGSHTCLPLEAGHIIIRQDGPACMCGNHGCLETLCSTPALFQALKKQALPDIHFRNTYGASSNQKAMETVAAAFHRGDPQVVKVLEDYAYTLCCGIVSIVNLFAVQSVYIGGAVRMLGRPFADLLDKTLRDHFHIITNRQQVTIDLFDDDLEASRKAAVTLTMEHIFQKN